MPYFHLDGIEGSDALKLIQLAETIPTDTTTLSFNGNDLGAIPVKAIVALFKAIPPSVESLQLAFTKLGKKTIAELVQIFTALPVGLISLDLSGNAIGTIPEKQLIQVFKAISVRLTNLELRENSLNKINFTDLLEAIKSLPVTLETLDLAINHFDASASDNLLESTNILINLNTLIWNTGTRLNIKEIHQEYEKNYDGYRNILDIMITNLEHDDLKIKLLNLLTSVDLLKEEGYRISELTKVLKQTIDLLKQDLSATSYLDYAKTVKGKSSPALIRVGQMMISVGLVVIALGITFTAGICCAGVVGGGSFMALAGIGFFHQGQNKGLSKKACDVADSFAKLSVSV